MNKRIRVEDVCKVCKRTVKVIRLIDMVTDGYYIVRWECETCGKEGFFQRRYKRKGGD